MFPFLTRKQLYRKYCYKSIQYKNIENENIPIKTNKPNKKEKKVRFKNEVYLTLIPTRHELDNLKYNIINYFEK